MMIHFSDETCRGWLTVVGVAVAVVILASSFEPVAAQTITTIDHDNGGQQFDYGPLLRVGGLALMVLTTYLLSFWAIFRGLLRTGSRPLQSYGISWSILLFGVTVAVLLFFSTYLTPDDWTERSSIWYKYKLHFLVFGVGFVLMIAPLFVFRSSRQA